MKLYGQACFAVGSRGRTCSQKRKPTRRAPLPVSSLSEDLCAARPNRTAQINLVRDSLALVEERPKATMSGRWVSLRLRLGRLKILIMLAFAGLAVGLGRTLAERGEEDMPRLYLPTDSKEYETLAPVPTVRLAPWAPSYPPLQRPVASSENGREEVHQLPGVDDESDRHLSESDRHLGTVIRLINLKCLNQTGIL